MSKVFISYSRLDRDFAEKIYADLVKNNIEVWMDVNIEAGSLWDDSIASEITQCEFFILIVSDSSISSDNVHDEITLARDECKIILPLIKEKCDIPYRLRRFNYVDFSNNYASGLSSLIHRLSNTNDFLYDPYEKISDNFLSWDEVEEIVKKKRVVFYSMICLALVFSFFLVLLDINLVVVLMIDLLFSSLAYIIMEYYSGIKVLVSLKNKNNLSKGYRFFLPTIIKLKS